MTLTQIDPSGLMQDAYQIEGISEPECRSIFLDWAMKLPSGDPQDAIRRVLAEYGAAQPDHPMTRVLTEGLGQAAQPARRGGRGGRPGRTRGA